MKYLPCLFLLLSTALLPAQQSTVQGRVFLDANHNQVADKGEKGIAGVVVSDQVSTVHTDNNGYFSIRTGQGDLPYVFISMPGGYSGSFYKEKGTQVNFPLSEAEQPGDFSFIHASDTHMDSLNLPRMRRFRAMADSLKVDFVLITGDLVRDALRVAEATARAYFEMYAGEIEKFSMPVYSTVGNHELFGIERDKSLVPQSHPLYGKKMFRHYLGPNYYSFNFGGWHFIAIDGVQYQNLYYYGGVDSLQLRWLEQDLEHVPENTPVVTFNHIPFISPGFSFTGYENDPYYGPQLRLQDSLMQHRHIVYNEKEVRARIGNRPYPLALAGHFHMAQRAEFEGTATRFAQTAAITRPDSFDYYGFKGRSGFTLYRVADGKLASTTFFILDVP